MGIAKALRLCRTVASRELGHTPLYLLPQSQLQVGLGTKYHYGFTHPHADLLYRHYIKPWRGRGPCEVINDIAIAEDFADEDFEYFIHCLALHGLGHILDRPELYDNEDCDDPDRLQSVASPKPRLNRPIGIIDWSKPTRSRSKLNRSGKRSRRTRDRMSSL